MNDPQDDVWLIDDSEDQGGHSTPINNHATYDSRNDSASSFQSNVTDSNSHINPFRTRDDLVELDPEPVQTFPNTHLRDQPADFTTAARHDSINPENPFNDDNLDLDTAPRRESLYELNDLDHESGLATDQPGFISSKRPAASDSSRFDIRHLWRKYILRRKERRNNDSGPRIITITDTHGRGNANYISTTKYNAATFLPKFLFEQFSKYANLFFLATALIQQVPNVSPTNRYTTIGTILIVLMVSATKELAEDWKRWRADKELNNSTTIVLQNGQWIERRWAQVNAGDIVHVNKEQAIPADLVVLSSSEPAGLCYIETANLDGETNLKIKQATKATQDMRTVESLGSLMGSVIESEQPNSSLYTYEGNLKFANNVIPLGVDQLLLRGTSLRNTAFVNGVVIFTGHETKLMRNATATPIKRTAVEHMMDYQIVFLLVVLFGMTITASLGSVVVLHSWRNVVWYLSLDNTKGVSTFFRDFLTYWILLSNLVPISLFVTIDIIKYWLGLLISSDMEMYDAEIDQPAICRTSSLVEELGQIKYIFSDKTGTLTRNVMEFKACCVNGQIYSTDIPEDKRGIYLPFNEKFESPGSPEQLLLIVLATCHTVIPEYDENHDEKTIIYQASSPDEGALVEGAAKLNIPFVARSPQGLSINVDGTIQNYELLEVCEFNSTRKRMSTILRCPDGKIRIFTKGADTVIFERLRNSSEEVLVSDALEEFASMGLRTLCLAQRELSESEYAEWREKYQKASTSLTDRAQELMDVAELIETKLELVGCTAIEDQLQDGVPETIASLQDAGCKVWVLTGDRQETAVNIGLSSKLLSEDMNLLIVNEDTHEEVCNNIRAKLDVISKFDSSLTASDCEDLALIIDGHSLTHALQSDIDTEFLDLACMCKAVICCRVSPLQKALVVKLAKSKLKDLLLAIGDGANDVSMIQAAHVGVGIIGKEGQQAARSADIAIGQFKYLQKLLLVHGMWSYNRLTRAILYSFYKNIALYLTQFWYVFFNGFSGESLYESWTVTFYNVFSTAFPPFAIGILDQFVSSRLLLRYPKLYKLGQEGKFLNTRQFWEWILNGIYHSVIIFTFCSVAYGGGNVLKTGLIANKWTYGAAMYTACCFTVLGKAALITNVWNSWTLFAIPGSAMFWLVCYPLYAEIGPMVNVGIENRGLIPALYPTCVFWALLLLVPSACLIRDITWKYWKRMYIPEYYHYVQEVQKYNIPDRRPRDSQFQKAIRKVRQVSRMRKQRGFAYSAADEGAERVVRAYDRK
ncbi:aminophospholipid-translocating P4-type ATPase [Starmerella bacillaris]|uniref:Phospholipid-transporting ATPase n=1 Tax=Starmerella bacillaris TaxID=1247836 RepID=A0AAV5RM21_STABA|nr:aminophospholipid-translocating P4-type ATPase [Starmerella bacillaris]